MLRGIALLAPILVAASLADSGEPFKPGKLPPAEVAALAPGMTMRFYARPDDKTPLDVRRVRLAALHVPADSPPSVFVAPGPFHATLTGYLKNPLKGDYSFKLVGSGALALKIKGKPVLTLPADKDKSVEIELAKNYNKIEIACTSSAKGETTMRLYWAGEKFGFEPVPPDVLFSRNDDADLVDKTVLREGRQLFADRHCASCHGAATALPEFNRKAPALDDAGDRFQHDWLAAWILNPRELRPEALMPSGLP